MKALSALSAPSWSWPLGLLALGLLCAALAGRWQKLANEAEQHKQLAGAVERVAQRLHGRMQRYESGVRSVRAVVSGAGPESITLEQFRAAMESFDLDSELPGARGFAYVRRVAPQREAEFLAERRAEMPDYDIRELVPHTGDHFCVQFIEPLQRNLDALGFDIASEPRRREAVMRATRDGQPQLSAPLQLVQSRHDGERALLLVLPIYDAARSKGAVPRERQAVGWSVVPMVIAEVLKDFDDDDGAIAMTLTDVTQPDAPDRFFASAAWQPPEAGTLLSKTTIRMAGRTWAVEAQALPPFEAQLHLRSPANVAIGVVLASAMLALLLHGFLLVEQGRRLVRRERATRAAVVDSAADAIIVHGLQDEVLSWNDAAERLLGWQASQVRGRRVVDLTVPPELRDEAMHMLQRVWQGEALAPTDSVRLDSTGQALDVAVTMVPVRNEHGQVAAVATTLRDIREQRAAQARIAELNATLEQQVHQRTSELQAVLDCAASAIIATDLEGRITKFNPAAQAMFRLPASQALGRSILDFCDPQELEQKAGAMPGDVKAHANALPAAFSEPMRRNMSPRDDDGHSARRSDWTYVRADGSRFFGLLGVSVLRDTHGAATGLLSVITDLSEIKSMEATLRQRTKQAELASRAKSAFLAHMSHEFRTPLNAVIGLSQLLGQLPLSDRARGYVRHIEQAGEQLLGLTNDVLDLSRIEAGEMKLEDAEFELLPLLHTVHALVQPLAMSKGLLFHFQVSTALPSWLRGDPLRLKQILLNLLSNAVKFTSSGSVKLHVQAVQRGAEYITLCFDVVDTGIGISPEVHAQIFDPFVQEDSSTTRRFGGSGLGLSIVRRLVEMMGGHIELRSTPGQGSSFSVTLNLLLASPR